MSLMHLVGIVLLMSGLIYTADLLNVNQEWNAVAAVIIIGLLVLTRVKATLTHKSLPAGAPDLSWRTPDRIKRNREAFIQASETGVVLSLGDLMTEKTLLSDVDTLRHQARQHIQEGAITHGYSADRVMIIKLLNDALATETICVLRYRRHHFMARGMHAKSIAEEFLVHANEEQGHADQIAERIVQLGGEPDFSPDTLSQRSHAEYVTGNSLADMIKEDLIAERIAIDSYREVIQYLAEQDSTTSLMLKGILAVEEKHADELASMLQDLPTAR